MSKSVTSSVKNRQRKTKTEGFEHKGTFYVPHNDLKHHEIALEQFTRRQAFWAAGLLLLIGLALVVNWHTTLLVLVAFLTTIYFADLLFNMFLIGRSLRKFPEIKISKPELASVRKNQWPTYTILCPLYKEAEVLPQFVRHIAKLDYDFLKLQVLLLLEEDDKATIKAAKAMKLPAYFEIVVVPHSNPKTKPKACNYGLKQATGEYIVIYDAEDAPDPKQLKKAYLAFKKSPEDVVCIQSKLNFYNPHHNILTRAFTAEYSTWFDLVLTGLQSIRAPIPLGGTSNHFKTKTLRELGGWDAFNVTEDADLGMRLARRGYQTAMVDSVTLEEANSNFKNWFWQRTRWIKGYIQTYLVHTRHRNGAGLHKWSLRHNAAFRLVIGGKIAMLFINPFMWALTISYFVFRATWGPVVESFYPLPILYMGAASLIFGNFLYMYYYMIGCAKREHFSLIKYVFLIPFYWLAMSIAAWRALYEVFARPHHWSKTKHGLHLGKNRVMKQVEASIAKAHDAEEKAKG